jgi:signal transduction histidine kinase
MRWIGRSALLVGAILALAVAGLAVVLANAHSSSRRELQRRFDERPRIAAAVFETLATSSVARSAPNSQIEHASVNAADLRALVASGAQARVVFDARGHLLAAVAFPGLSLQETVRDAQAIVPATMTDPLGVEYGNVDGPPASAVVVQGSTYVTPFGTRIQAVDFPVPQIGALLGQYLSQVSQNEGEAYLVDQHGRVVGGSSPDVEEGGLLPDRALVNELPQAASGFYTHNGAQWYYSSAAIVGLPWRAVFATSTASLYAPAEGINTWVSWVLLALFALTALAVLVLITRVGRDTARLGRANRDLELRNAEALEANAAKSRFLANMSHELRTPLNGIIGFAELMYDGRVGPVSEEHREFLADILSSSRHLLGLINDVLDLSKIEAGRIDVRAEDLELEPLVSEVTSGLAPLVRERRIHVDTEIASELGHVWLDPVKFRQVLFNYLSNALKFCDDGGRVSIRLRTEQEGFMRLEVQDSGIGIAPQDVDRLFNEFSQLDSSRSKRFAGTGLGLALTRRIVEAQGGSVGVNSILGHGSVFYAVLPCRRPIRVAPAEDDPSTGDAAEWLTGSRR